MAIALTMGQARALGFIRSYLAENGTAPTMEEMAAGIGLKSKSGAHRLVTALEERGHIRRLALRPRAMELTEKLPSPKTADVPRVRVIVDAMNRVRRWECSGEVTVVMVKEWNVLAEGA